MPLAVLLPIVAFIALALALAIVLRRAGRIVARTREVDGFRHAVAELCGRIETSLDGATGRIDAVRRQTVGADSIGPTIDAARDAVGRYLQEATALEPPAAGTEIQTALIEELERSGRALDMVEHGATILAQVRRRGRELEAQTAIKRGYLNLLHAREAIALQAQRAAVLDANAEPAEGGSPITVRQPRP